MKIISGGQTGVDRAALDFALACGIACGGWCPKGRRAEDCPIPDRYPLTETDTDKYPARTALNVRDADATLILTRGQPDRGTALTQKLTQRYKKPLFVVDLDHPPEPAEVRTWLDQQHVRVLNVAGPRESSCPGIGAQASQFLRAIFTGPSCW
jgi:hypothetical protein